MEVKSKVEDLRKEGIRVSFLDLDPYLVDRRMFQRDMIHLNEDGVKALGRCILQESWRLDDLGSCGRVPPPAGRR